MLLWSLLLYLKYKFTMLVSAFILLTVWKMHVTLFYNSFSPVIWEMHVALFYNFFEIKKGPINNNSYLFHG